MDSKERVEVALANLEALAAADSNAAVKRAACRDLLEYEGKIGPGAALRTRKAEHKVDEKIVGVFIAVLAEVGSIDRSISLEGESVGDTKGDSEDKPLLPV